MRLKDEVIEIILTIKQMICNPLMMIIGCLWVVITRQESSRLRELKQLAEQDMKNKDNDVMSDESIHGMATTVSLVSNPFHQ
jgi:predicted histidine transporter YuiF (NhaC family)